MPPFTIKNRHASWKKLYPKGPYWRQWHTFLLGHNPSGFPVMITATEMAQIWYTHTIKTIGAQHLLRFELNTLLGALPKRSAVFRGLLDALADAALDSQLGLWQDLAGHYQKHGIGDEQPILQAAAIAVRTYALRVPEFDSQDIEFFFSGKVDSPEAYGMLALSVIILSQIDSDLFQLSLYSPDAPQRHSLSLNLKLSSGFIEEFSGMDGGYGLTVGITLAGVISFSLDSRKVYHIPAISPYFTISTLFAPDGPSTSKLLMSGYATALTLA